MEKWNDKVVKQHIEELITESYLLCLNEKEIRKYLKCFLDSCETVLQDGAVEQRDLKLAGIRVAILKGYFLLSADSLSVPNPARNAHGKSSESKSNLELFAEQVVGVRSLILRLLTDYDQKVAQAVLADADRKNTAAVRCAPGRRLLYTAFLHSGYFALLAATICMIWIILIH
jgi:hypothetical protein